MRVDEVRVDAARSRDDAARGPEGGSSPCLHDVTVPTRPRTRHLDGPQRREHGDDLGLGEPGRGEQDLAVALDGPDSAAPERGPDGRSVDGSAGARSALE